MKLKEIYNEILQNPDYNQLEDWIDKNLFESYYIIGELLNPSNSFEYQQTGKGYWSFIDTQGYEFFVRVVYQPTTKSFFEIKMGWVDLPKQQRYLQQSNREIDERRGDTIAKIYRDEIIPFFQNQYDSNKLVIKPLDIKRYQFSLRLINKFTPSSLNIKENKPQEIIITK